MKTLIVILSLLITACASQTSGTIKDFAVVTNSSAEINQQLITEYENSLKEIHFSHLVKAKTDLNIELNGLGLHIPELNLPAEMKAAQKGVTEKSEQLTAVNKALLLYSVLLVKLAAAGSVEDINKASTNFSTSLTQFNSSLKTAFSRQNDVIDSAQIATISSVIDTAAVAGVDYYRNIKIKQVVNDANVMIINIHYFLVNNLATPGVIGQVYMARRLVFGNEINDFNKINQYASTEQLRDKYIEIDKKQKALSEESERNFRRGLIRNLDNIKEAHQKLTDVVNDNDFSKENVMILIEQIKIYVDQYKKFNSSLVTN
ncbi:TPA: hypothetical protein PXN07_002873 [Yersinia enterocolitica]|uniref:hypothetical protein n=1 Tax=Yersinia enterocolitica TaxID=630 RepID=UPI0029AA83B9|nr:hypothetical protein [Yersinia enterocolitica]EKN5984177.1 hypothetical protein [Yersinia enterocolitica]EKN5989955.1 hypothetical protein [Yersinia enterocolitica]ELX2242266.1 hypothetical protein [Yersinia enterocolitica]HDL6714556.1 hypothetical protein [Yersinia enterocolitica]